MFNKGIFKISNLKRKVKEGKVDNLEALSALDEILNDHFTSLKLFDRDLELDLYIQELNKLMQINQKAKQIELDINSLRRDNMLLMQELNLSYKKP